MKKISLFVMLFLLVITLSACSDLCVGTSCITGDTDTEPDPIDPVVVDCTVTPEHEDCIIEPTGPVYENILTYPHINGHGTVNEEQNAYVLFEEEMLGYVKYQVTYLSCTCRNSDVNYWQVMYIEISTTDNSVRRISFDMDKEEGSHPYTAGMWGDSSPTPGPSGDYSDGKLYEDFVNDYIPWLVGQTPESLEGITLFSNEAYHDVPQNTQTIDDQDLIDSFAGSSVSTNNMIRIVHAMFEYHIKNYS
jgi:hypothetical protein